MNEKSMQELFSRYKDLSEKQQKRERDAKVENAILDLQERVRDVFKRHGRKSPEAEEVRLVAESNIAFVEKHMDETSMERIAFAHSYIENNFLSDFNVE